MKPSEIFESKRKEIRELVGCYTTVNPRVFGSVLHGTDKYGSDLDLLVDALPGTTLLDMAELQDALEALLGVPVDLKTPGDLSKKFRDEVVAEAMPV